MEQKFTKKEHKEIYQALDFCCQAKGKDEYGYDLDMVEVKNGRLAATDGCRIHYTPAKDIPDGLYKVTKKNSTITLDLVNGKTHFPDIDKEIAYQKPYKHRVSVNRKEFIHAVRQARIITSSTYRGVAFKFNGKLDIQAINPDIGDMETWIDTDGKVEPEIAIGLNPNYILDALNKFQEERVFVEINHPERPIVFSENGKSALICAMRL